jgi:hypothetical protein
LYILAMEACCFDHRINKFPWIEMDFNETKYLHFHVWF